MRINGVVAAAFTALAIGMASSAQAAVINIAGNAASIGGPSFYEVNFDFLLPVGFSNAVLTISELSVDDRGVLRLNGTNVDAAGINCCGSPGFDFNDGNGTIPFSYALFNGARNVVVNSGFLAGNNGLRLLVNDTNAGVAGTLLNGPGGPSSTTGYSFAGTVSFDAAPAGPGVPEPATWAMMLIGFFGLGSVIRRQRGLRTAGSPAI